MSRSFDGKVALLTGGGSGIGRVAALRFSARGARVVVADINPEAAEETARQVTAGGGSALAFRTDVIRPSDLEELVSTAVSRLGRLDIAVNCAGVGGSEARVHDYAEDDWQRIIGVNLTGVWLSMKYELPPMLERGGGAIVNVASVAGVVGFPRHSAYAASKHGVIGLTRSAALEYARKGIRVNAVCPAFTETPMVEAMLEHDPERRTKLESAIPMRRFGRPEETADAILYLCSEEAGFITGQSLVIDGGLTAG